MKTTITLIAALTISAGLLKADDYDDYEARLEDLEAEAEERAESLEILQRQQRARESTVIISPGVSSSVQVITPGTVIDYRGR